VGNQSMMMSKEFIVSSFQNTYLFLLDLVFSSSPRHE